MPPLGSCCREPGTFNRGIRQEGAVHRRMWRWAHSMACDDRPVRSRKEQVCTELLNWRISSSRASTCFLKHLFPEPQKTLKKTETVISIWRYKSFMPFAVNIVEMLWRKLLLFRTGLGTCSDAVAGTGLLVLEE